VITASNSFEVSINGEKAGQGGDFHHPVTLDITRLMRSGDNAVEIEAGHSGGSAAGLIAKLRFDFAEGIPQEVVTEQEWQVSNDHSAWAPAKPLGPAGMEPWGKLPDARRLPARYLRREFAVTKKVKRATAYVCGLGFFDLFVNGEKISDDVMDPALSDYSKAAYAVTFDVTDRLRAGGNALGVILGNGRFYAPRLEIPAHTTTYGYPKLLLQLEVEYADGSKTTVVSDEGWRLTTDGPIRANNEYDGEECADVDEGENIA